MQRDLPETVKGGRTTRWFPRMPSALQNREESMGLDGFFVTPEFLHSLKYNNNNGDLNKVCILHVQFSLVTLFSLEHVQTLPSSVLMKRLDSIQTTDDDIPAKRIFLLVFHHTVKWF